MKAKSVPQNIQGIVRVDFAPMAPKLKGLFFNIERELEHKANENPGHRCFNQATIFLRVSTLSMYNCYATILWLGSEAEESRRRPKDALLTIPSITRTMIDVLFTTVFMFDQGRFLPNYVWYAKSSYREASEELLRYKRDFPQHEDYINFFEDELGKYALGLKEHLQATDSEISKPSQLERWPTLTQVLNPKRKYTKTPSSECTKFFVWLNDWSYREISQIAHHSAWGVSKIGSFLLKDSLGQEMQNRIDGDSIHRFRSGQISSALTVLLCFASEINQHYNLRHNEELLLIWQYFNKVPMIQEAWNERYKQLLST